MADNFLYVQAQPFSLAGSGVAIGATTIVLNSMKDIDGTNLAMTDFGSIGFGTIDPNNGTSEEQISFSGITQNANGTATLTGVKTVLMKAPYTQTSGLAKSHTGGAKFVISNTAGFYDKLTSKSDDETVTGTWTFTSTATPRYNTHPTFTADAEIIDKKYADDLAIAGSPNASTSVKGIAEEATAAEINAGTAAGGTGAELFINPSYLASSIYNSQLPTSDQKAALAGSGTPSAANKFVTADTDALKQTIANLSTNITTDAASTTKYPAVKTIKDYVDAFSPTTTNGQTTKDCSDASGTQTIAHGLGKIPKKVRIMATATVSWGVTGGWVDTHLVSTTIYNGTTQTSVSSYMTAAARADGYSTSFILGGTNGGGTQTGVVTFDATNISIAWTKASSPTGSYTITWEAQ